METESMNGFYLFMHNTALKLNALIIPRAGKFFFFQNYQNQGESTEEKETMTKRMNDKIKFFCIN